jgi:hypothetical protein
MVEELSLPDDIPVWGICSAGHHEYIDFIAPVELTAIKAAIQNPVTSLRSGNADKMIKNYIKLAWRNLRKAPSIFLHQYIRSFTGIAW